MYGAAFFPDLHKQRLFMEAELSLAWPGSLKQHTNTAALLCRLVTYFTYSFTYLNMYYSTAFIFRLTFVDMIISN